MGSQVLCIEEITLIDLLLLYPRIELLYLLVLIKSLVLAALAVVKRLSHFSLGLLHQAGGGGHCWLLWLDRPIPGIVLYRASLQVVCDEVLSQLFPLLAPQPPLFVDL